MRQTHHVLSSGRVLIEGVRRIRSTRSRWVALALIGAGLLALGGGTLTHATAFHWLPSIDGVLVTGLLGFVLLVLHGLGFLRAILAIAPVVAVQIPLCLLSHAPVLSLVGVELLFFGAVGLAIGAWRASEHQQ